MITKIVAIRISARSSHASKVQDILTKHGCLIKTRLGCSEAGCTESGLIILQTIGLSEDITKLEKDLNQFDDVSVNSMII
ncbi:MAG: hypothetical protein N4A47_04930 [Clostridia bacterium]|jgi:hypothetical protein|nr:hypothetical protein [Clostridia bacterium]